MIKLNLAGVSTGPLPVGEYPAMITGVKEGQTPKGKSMVTFEFTVTDGDYQGRKAWRNVTVEDSTRWVWRQLLEAVADQVPGVSDVLDSEEGFELDVSELVGCYVRIVVKETVNPVSGQNTTNVARVLAP